MMLVVFIGLFASFSIFQNAYGFTIIAKASILVVDEDGSPIEGAKAGFAFEENKIVGVGVNISPIDGFTDINGKYTASHRNDNNILTYGVEKEGYYFSKGKFVFTGKNFRGWEPWNPEIIIVMRKIINPVPMYARDSKMANIKIKIPVIGKDIGFDLMAYDWVYPYGKGRQSDFIFYLEKSYSGFNNYEATLTIKFYDKKNGIVKIKENKTNESQFKLPRFAPEEGYATNLKIIRSKSLSGKKYMNYNSNDNYVFRVRSELDDDKLIRAMYGKIIGPIEIDPRREPTEVYFKYYLNPDYTRNLEFDPKRNLFGNLPSLEQVKEP